MAKIHIKHDAIGLIIITVLLLGIISLSYRISKVNLESAMNKNMLELKHPVECAKCVSKVPCSYRDEVNLRILVFTYDRLKSLQKCLRALQNADYMGDTIALEIWIDISTKGVVNKAILEYAKEFQFQHGSVCVHVQTEHANVANQWIYSWQPKIGTEELAVFIEDDTDVSQHFYRYLKSARKFYRNYKEINVYCLTDENIPTAKGPKIWKQITRPKETKDIVFLYPLICSWGYAPEPAHWRGFQDWYHNNVSKIRKYDPTDRDAVLHSGWYRGYMKKGKADTIKHSMFLMKYASMNNLYALYPNLRVLVPGNLTSLTSNRREKGLHMKGNKSNHVAHALKEWSDEFVNFPHKPVKLDWAGEQIK